MMRALTLHQPWACFMAWGLKKIETRSWAPPAWLTDQWVAIHAGKNRDSIDHEYVGELLSDARAELTPTAVSVRVPDSFYTAPLPLGAIVAVGNLRRVRPTEDLLMCADIGTDFALGNYASGRFGWVFEPVIACPTPIECRGAQGLWEVPAAIEQELLALIECRPEERG